MCVHCEKFATPQKRPKLSFASSVALFYCFYFIFAFFSPHKKYVVYVYVNAICFRPVKDSLLLRRLVLCNFNAFFCSTFVAVMSPHFDVLLCGNTYPYKYVCMYVCWYVCMLIHLNIYMYVCMCLC